MSLNLVSPPLNINGSQKRKIEEDHEMPSSKRRKNELCKVELQMRFIIANFPKELWQNILSQIASVHLKQGTQATHLHSVSNVCKIWREIILILIERKFIPLVNYGFKEIDPAIRYVTMHRFKHINLTSYADMQDSHLDLLAKFCGNLEKIAFIPNKLSVNKINYLGLKFPNIRSVDLKGVVSGQVVKSLLENCHNLEKIALFLNPSAESTFFIKELKGDFQKIKKIQYCFSALRSKQSNSVLDDETVKNISATAPNLEKVILRGLQISTDALQHLLKNSSYLTLVDLSNSRMNSNAKQLLDAYPDVKILM